MAVENSHNDAYRTSFMIYNPQIKNPSKRKISTNLYGGAIPTTILDIMHHTKSFSQTKQQEMAIRFAANYEHSQSFLRPVKETFRFFSVNPGGTQWVVDDGSHLRVSIFSQERVIDY